MRSIFKKTIPLLATIFGVLYFAMFAAEFATSESIPVTFESVTVLIMFLVYLVGLVFSWLNEKIGGLLLMIWYLGVWILSYHFWPEAGMVIILALPGLYMGMFLYQKGFLKKKATLSRLQREKHLLLIFMINYAVLYAVAAIPLFALEMDSFLEFPMIAFPILFLLFLVSFIYSWNNKLISGLLLLLWYIVVVVFTFISPEFLNEGPTFAFGITLLIQGIMYIKLFTQEKKQQVKIT